MTDDLHIRQQIVKLLTQLRWNMESASTDDILDMQDQFENKYYEMRNKESDTSRPLSTMDRAHLTLVSYELREIRRELRARRGGGDD